MSLGVKGLMYSNVLRKVCKILSSVPYLSLPIKLSPPLDKSVASVLMR